MNIKLYQVEAVAGAACALLLGVLRHGMSTRTDAPLLATLEAASFGLCCIGTVSGARALRTRYEILGSNKAVARLDSGYMAERRETQLTAALATVAVATLAGSRYGLDPLLVGLAALVAMAVILPVTNRMTGWSAKT